VTATDVLAGLPDRASAQVAGEVFGTPQYGGAPLRAVAARRGAARLRCASVLKPLIVWMAGGGRNDDAERAHSGPSPRGGAPPGCAALRCSSR